MRTVLPSNQMRIAFHMRYRSWKNSMVSLMNGMSYVKSIIAYQSTSLIMNIALFPCSIWMVFLNCVTRSITVLFLHRQIRMFCICCIVTGKAFFAALADYKAHPDKYEAVPHIPRYADKDGYKPLIFTNQICKLRKDKHGWYVKFPKAVLQAGCVRDRYDLGKMDLHEQKLKEVRLIPNGDTIKLEIVCEIEIMEPTITIHEATRVAGIDIGVDNLMAIAFTSGHRPVLIKGNEIKAVKQFYNKQIAHYRSLLRTGKKDSKGIHQTKRMKRISEKRNRRVKDILHKASRKIIDLCVEEGIEVIVVGNHAGWKKRIHMGKKNNQTFVQIPFHT